MRAILALSFLAIGAFAAVAAGQGFETTASFPEGAGATPNFKRLVIEFEQIGITLTTDNNCPRVAHEPAGDRQVPCTELYRLENRTTPFAAVAIDTVNATPGLFPQLEITLHDAPKTLKSLVFVALNLQSSSPKGPAPVKGYVEVPVASQLSQKDDPGTEPFVALRGTQQVFYRSVIPVVIPPAELERFRAKLSSAMSITDPADFDRPYVGEVTGFKNVDSVGFVHEITVSGAPRGKKVTVKIAGVEKFGAEDLQAGTAVQTKALPKAREDADLWVKLAIDTDSVKKDRKYSVDTRMHSGWRDGRWDVGPTLDGTFGNVTSKAPNTAALSFDFKYWLNVADGGVLHSQSVTLSPVYRTDRSFDNRDLGADLVYEPIFRVLDQTLDERRKAEKRLGGPPLAKTWGWRIRPSFALETGRHIASVSADVRHTDFSRLRFGLSSTIEWLQWKLTISGQTRHLFSSELLLQDKGVVQTAKSDKNYGRIDLSYDLGAVSIVSTHMNGRQPPAFSSTHSTSLGIVFKF